MRGFFLCCCFSPSRTLETDPSGHEFDRPRGSAADAHRKRHQRSSGARPYQRCWWKLRNQSHHQNHADSLLGQHSRGSHEQTTGLVAKELQLKQNALLQTGKSIKSDDQIKAGYTEEKTPLIMKAFSTVTEPIAPAASLPDVGDGYERTPFCPDVRWSKDRNARMLSSGGTATVYRAERMHSSNDSTSLDSSAVSTAPVTHVAIKAMMEDQGDNAQLAQHEAQVLESLSNRGYVPQFHGYYTDPETKRWHRRAYVLTQLVPGCSVDDLCYKVRTAASRMQKPQQLQDLRRWMWGFSMHTMLRLLQALDDLHQERSHRDMKAGNVMVSDWDKSAGLKIHLIDWANSRLHAEEHLLNEYCTPEYSSPQLIAAITNLPAPVMDDRANDIYGCGVVLFQMLVSTVPGPQMPFEPNYQQVGGLVGADKLRGIQKSVQQQQADWANCNPVYKAATAQDATSVGEHAKQPWQLAAMQIAADFGDDEAVATERNLHIAAILSGMLHPEVAERLTATQLVQQHWLGAASSMDLGPCPILLQR